MFQYDSAVLARYPTIHAGVVRAEGVANGPTPAALEERYRVVQREAAERLAVTTVAELPSIGAWRRAFAAFGAKPTQYRSAAEALQRRLAKHGDIPSINALVDLGNLVSIRYALPVAVLDVDGIAGGITVRFATGTERFTDLGCAEATAPEPGEVVFVDREDVACARRWCWRQSAQSATRPGTTEALIVVEGLHGHAATDVAAALDDVTALLGEFQPGARLTTSSLRGAA